MKNNFDRIISVLTCIALVFCLLRIRSLEGEINSLRSSMAQRIDNVSRDVNNISYNVRNTLEQQASLITGDEWQYISADMNAKTATVSCSVTAKEYTPGVTQAFVTAAGQQFELVLADGSFTGQITIPLYEETVIYNVSFKENDKITNQPLDWHFFPRYEYLTVVYADFNWSGRGSKAESKDNVYRWIIEDGEIDVDVDRQNGSTKIISMDMVEIINGVETKRTAIPLDGSGAKTDDRMFASQEPTRPEYAGDYQNTNLRYDLTDYIFEIPFGSTLDVYVETVDGDGLLHRNQIAQFTVSSDGRNIDQGHQWWHGAESIVFDRQGNLIYGNEELMK